MANPYLTDKKLVHEFCNEKLVPIATLWQQTRYSCHDTRVYRQFDFEINNRLRLCTEIVYCKCIVEKEAMASWGKEKPKLRMPVRVGTTRNTIGHLYNGSTLHRPTALPAPRNVVKTPQGLKLVPAKRNILGQCLANSPSFTVGLSSQAKEPIQRKIPRPVYNNNARVKALMVADGNQNLNEASNLKPLTSSPLVPLEEYEEHHKGKSNIGIFNDFEKFRTLPEVHTVRVPFLPSETPFAEGVSGVRPAKLKSNSVSKYKKKYTSKSAGVKVSKPPRQTLIPISVPKSPHLVYSTRKDPLKTSTLGHIPATNIKEHSDLLFSKSSVLDIPYVYKTNTNVLSLTDKHESELQHSNSQLEQQNESLTRPRPVEQLCCNYEEKLPHPGNLIKHDQPCKVSLTNNAQTCNSFKLMQIDDGKPNESQNTRRSCDLHCMFSCVYPLPEMEEKYISLLQEQYDLQKQQADLQKQLSDIQHKQSNCLQKMIEFREENFKLLRARSVTPTQVQTNIADRMPVTPIPEIITESPSPVPTRRRRSVRLAMQSKSELDKSQFIATTNSVIDIHTDLSMTEDIDSTRNALEITSNSTKKRDTRRKSVVNYNYGELRSAFKHLLRTPKDTPVPGKSAKKVQFTVEDTPARLSSNVMKQLNSLYDS